MHDQALERALTRHRAGETAAAEALYAAILAVDPHQPNALHLSGLLHFETGYPGQALARWEALAAVCPREPQAWFLVADARRALGDRAGEAQAYGRALAIDPSSPAAWLALGAAELAGGKPEAAVDAYEHARTLSPADASVRAGLAAALCAADRVEDAVAAAEQATALQPDLAQAWFVLGGGLKRAGRLPEAAAAFERTCALEPRFAAARLSLAAAYGALDREAEAEQALRAALAIDPALREAVSNLAFLLIGADRVDEAAALCEAALACDPEHAEARWALTLALLRKGDYARGWPLYARCEWEGPAKARFAAQFETPMWRGEPLDGRTLLILASEGLGDTLQFSRFAKVLTAQGARCVLACDPKLHGLMRRTPGVAAVIARDAPTPEHDVWVEQMSLPWLLGATIDAIPSCEGDMVVDARKAAAWAGRLPPGRKVGIVWSGNPTHPNDARRSMATAEIAPLLAAPGWTPVSLQVGPRSGEIASLFGVADHSAALADFEETAALVANLDLVIAVDTAVAHLAGAMGKPTWVLLSATAEWRWLAGRDDTPWYPAMRTFRQARLGDWTGVVARVRRALETQGAAVPKAA
jgi:tetratricopeptide (TPR) repeat protein